jgi:hypothetical protein
MIVHVCILYVSTYNYFSSTKDIKKIIGACMLDGICIEVNRVDRMH